MIVRLTRAILESALLINYGPSVKGNTLYGWCQPLINGLELSYYGVPRY
jgi:hypothetical protein